MAPASTESPTDMMIAFLFYVRGHTKKNGLSTWFSNATGSGFRRPKPAVKTRDPACIWADCLGRSRRLLPCQASTQTHGFSTCDCIKLNLSSKPPRHHENWGQGGKGERGSSSCRPQSLPSMFFSIAFVFFSFALSTRQMTLFLDP